VSNECLERKQEPGRKSGIQPGASRESVWINPKEYGQIPKYENKIQGRRISRKMTRPDREPGPERRIPKEIPKKISVSGQIEISGFPENLRPIIYIM